MNNDNQNISTTSQKKEVGGVKTPEGKEISKYNAQTHGILRLSITEYEKEFYFNILNNFITDFKPQGTIEQILVERITLYYLKLFRVQKAETEFIKGCLKPTEVEIEMNPTFCTSYLSLFSS